MSKYKNKKRGFTVAELAVAVLIIGVLAALLIPMAASQLKRGDEYRYYLAYKTVEKIAKQVVAEPVYDDNTTAYSPFGDTKIAQAAGRVVFETNSDIVRDKIDQTKDILAGIITPPAYASWCTDLNSIDPDHSYSDPDFSAGEEEGRDPDDDYLYYCEQEPHEERKLCNYSCIKNGRKCYAASDGRCYWLNELIEVGDNVKSVEIFSVPEFADLVFYDSHCNNHHGGSNTQNYCAKCLNGQYAGLACSATNRYTYCPQYKPDPMVVWGGVDFTNSWTFPYSIEDAVIDMVDAGDNFTGKDKRVEYGHVYANGEPVPIAMLRKGENTTSNSYVSASDDVVNQCSYGGWDPTACAVGSPKYTNTTHDYYSKSGSNISPGPDGINDFCQFEGYEGFRIRFISMISPLVPYIDWDMFERRLLAYYLGRLYNDEGNWFSSSAERKTKCEQRNNLSPEERNNNLFYYWCNNKYLDTPTEAQKFFNHRWLGISTNGNACRASELDYNSTACKADDKYGAYFQWVGNSAGVRNSVLPRDRGGAGHSYGEFSEFILPSLIRHKDADVGATIRYGYGSLGNAYSREDIRITAKISSAFPDIPPVVNYNYVPAQGDHYCTKPPYVNMKKDDLGSSCICGNPLYPSRNYIPTKNDTKACLINTVCNYRPGTVPYYYRTGPATGTSRCCVEGSYNPITGYCCGDESTNPLSRTGSGWIYTGGQCKKIDSEFRPVGYILGAKDFCKKIRDNFNVKESNCDDGFMSGGTGYSGKYVSKATDNNSISALSNKVGGFIPGASGTITRPHIEFSNGIVMWILSDREPSLKGVSFPLIDLASNSTPNWCVNQKLVTVTNASTSIQLRNECQKPANETKGFAYCPGENKCYSMRFNPSTNSDLKKYLPDARSCCMSYDLEYKVDGEDKINFKQYNPVPGFTVYVDINGLGAGSGTLWDDVFPFYILTNGTVLPGYPIDASRTAQTGKTSVFMGGNNAAYLPVDVYYYKPSGNARRRVNVATNVSFARGACLAGIVPEQTFYCQNIFNREDANQEAQYQKERQVCRDQGNCMIYVKKKSRIF